jgi:hypothetical protein
MNPLQVTTISTEHLAVLRQTIIEYFSDSDLRNACFDLGIDYEVLPGQSKADKVRELILFFRNRGRIPHLVQYCIQQRPTLSWTRFISGAQINFDVQKMVDMMQQTLPPGDSSPQNLLETLKQFQCLHILLSEWKELHNLLNDIIQKIDQFEQETVRITDKDKLKEQWEPVAGKIELSLTWAKTIRFISPPYAKRSDGGMEGPKWAIELSEAKARIDDLFQSDDLDTNMLRNTTREFIHIVKNHMFKADKSLRTVVSELYNLSSAVLGSVIHEQV